MPLLFVQSHCHRYKHVVAHEGKLLKWNLKENNFLQYGVIIIYNWS